jgi:hypothetical protein
MLTGVALALSELPAELVARSGLKRRVHDRGGEAEVRFLFANRQRMLPVWLDGELLVIAWGNRRGESRSLPVTGWTRQSSVEAGVWGERALQPVVIPATLGLDRGIWYSIRQGVQGLVVRDEAGRPRVYVVCEPASHYYRTMTRSDWMPALVGERI